MPTGAKFRENLKLHQFKVIQDPTLVIFWRHSFYSANITVF